MAFQSKVNHVSIDDTGRINTVRDSTGVYSIENPTGYGGPNLSIGAINRIIIGLKEYADCDEHRIIFTPTPNPENPFEFSSPTIAEITGGADINLSSVNLLNYEVELRFNDDVYDLNMYTVIDETVNAVGNIYEKEVSLEGIGQYNSYDAIISNDGEIYLIDRSKGTFENVIYLATTIKSDFTSFQPVYIANSKFFTDYCTSYNLANLVPFLNNNPSGEFRKNLMEIEQNMWAVPYAIQQLKYHDASLLLTTAQRLSEQAFDNK